jgi:hypothetical protein
MIVKLAIRLAKRIFNPNTRKYVKVKINPKSIVVTGVGRIGIKKAKFIAESKKILDNRYRYRLSKHREEGYTDSEIAKFLPKPLTGTTLYSMSVPKIKKLLNQDAYGNKISLAYKDSIHQVELTKLNKNINNMEKAVSLGYTHITLEDINKYRLNKEKYVKDAAKVNKLRAKKKKRLAAR